MASIEKDLDPRLPSARTLPTHKTNYTQSSTLSRSQAHVKVIAHPFAGRLGGAGDQDLALSPDHPDFDEIVRRTPDAAPVLSWRESLEWRPFLERDLWKAGVFEAWEWGMVSLRPGGVFEIAMQDRRDDGPV
ncbi:MAG: hypothetical protein M1819_007342 [Sarea resinae]|nr:MAG: hypothetical protein M1819_007342 [Sarea resinae]